MGAGTGCTIPTAHPWGCSSSKWRCHHSTWAWHHHRRSRPCILPTRADHPLVVAILLAAAAVEDSSNGNVIDRCYVWRDTLQKPQHTHCYERREQILLLRTQKEQKDLQRTNNII